ncbi:MAG: restriction endonuclease subunit S [Tannerellaceae bacterium]|nr:restriction endonuclease subunit S [Tannerellaceae bacterium]
MKKLAEIVSIRSGIYCKTNLYKEEQDGRIKNNSDIIRYIQAVDFEEGGELKVLANDSSIVLYESKFDKHYLKPDEILLVTKGNHNYAAIYPSSGLNYSSIASSSFLVLTITDKTVLPEYLCWYLNYEQTQNKLKEFRKGTSIPSISKSLIEGLEIKIPALEQQKQIVELAQLIDKEYRIQTKMRNLKKQLLIKAIQ